jgi:hypothetical protein
MRAQDIGIIHAVNQQQQAQASAQPQTESSLQRATVNTDDNMDINELQSQQPKQNSTGNNNLVDGQTAARGRSLSSASSNNGGGFRPIQPTTNANPGIHPDLSDTHSVASSNSRGRALIRTQTQPQMPLTLNISNNMQRSASPTVSNLTRCMSVDRIRGSARQPLYSRSPSPRRAKQWVLQEEKSLAASK